MTHPRQEQEGGERIRLFTGAFYIPDYAHPAHHSGDLVHYSHLIETAEQLAYPRRIGGQAFNALYTELVLNAERTRQFAFSSYKARSLDWRYNRFSSSPIQTQKRLHLFFTNELVADGFYNHVLPNSTDWPSQHLDVTEALLKARGHARESEKRAIQLQRRAES